jgi:hypothetical protein
MKPLFLAAILAAAALTLLPQTTYAQSDPTFAIDVGIQGNGSTNVEEIENCVEVTVGDRFQVDVVVQDITDLLAWEIPIDYDPTVVTLVGQDVKMFQQANEGSSVLDLSAKLPDDSGFHALAAFDSADPESPDSGTGVLARITFEAVGAGDSPIRFGNRDYDNDGTLDRGSLIRAASTEIIGDDNEDTFFDGEQEDAQAVVDGTCPDGTIVGEASTVGEEPNTPVGDDDSSTPWAVIGGGVAAGIVALLVLAFLLTRRRGRRSSPA